MNERHFSYGLRGGCPERLDENCPKAEGFSHSMEYQGLRDLNRSGTDIKVLGDVHKIFDYKVKIMVGGSNIALL